MLVVFHAGTVLAAPVSVDTMRFQNSHDAPCSARHLVESKRRGWTPEQVRTLKSLAKRNKHAASIAKTLKRTEGAMRQKAFSMGLSLDSLA
jgi:hypothetical protein